MRKNKEIFAKAYALGGYRERYAMEHGQPEVIYTDNRRLVRFVYSENDLYQDANGATYDISNNKWM